MMESVGKGRAEERLHLMDHKKCYVGLKET